MVDQTGVLPIVADRWTAFTKTLSFIGIDWTDAVFAAQVRTEPDVSGPPLVDLATVGTSAAEGVHLIYAGSDTIDAHVAAGRLDDVPEGFAGTDAALLSQVGIRINEATMEGLPFPAERGDDLQLAWDLHITPAGGLKEKWLEGRFTVHAGVTQ